MTVFLGLLFLFIYRQFLEVIDVNIYAVIDSTPDKPGVGIAVINHDSILSEGTACLGVAPHKRRDRFSADVSTPFLIRLTVAVITLDGILAALMLWVTVYQTLTHP